MRIHRFLCAAVMSLCSVVPAADVWIGTSAHPLSRGIYHCTLNEQDGRLSEPTLAAAMHGPGFLARHPSLPVLYAVGGFQGEPSVVAWSIERTDTGPVLKRISAVAVGDGGATHLAVDPAGRVIVTAQYGGGSTAVFGLQPDGSLRERLQLIRHDQPSGVRPNQTRPHPHWAGFSPDGRFVFVPDLGKDRVVIYAYDPDTGTPTPHGSGRVPPGAGPRHMKFHPNGRWIYVLNENDVSVTLFDYDPTAGTMQPRQTLPAVPKERLLRERRFSGSEIRVRPDGRFVYSATRGHDTVTVFRVHPKTGNLTVVEREPVRGARPRNFGLDPSGKWLLAAGQDSHTLASFAIDEDTGELTYSQSVVPVPAPICVLIED